MGAVGFVLFLFCVCGVVVGAVGTVHGDLKLEKSPKFSSSFFFDIL